MFEQGCGDESWCLRKIDLETTFYYRFKGLLGNTGEGSRGESGRGRRPKPFQTASRDSHFHLLEWDGLTGMFPKTKWNSDVIFIFKERTFL